MFEEQKKQINQIVQDKMIRVVYAITKKLVEESPVWTGEYVKSHEVALEARGYPRIMEPTGTPPFPDPLS